MGRKHNNCFEVVAVDRGIDGFAWHTTQADQSNPSSGFTDWSTLYATGGLGQIAIGTDSDRRLWIFAIQRK